MFYSIAPPPLCARVAVSLKVPRYVNSVTDWLDYFSIFLAICINENSPIMSQI